MSDPMRDFTRALFARAKADDDLPQPPITPREGNQNDEEMRRFIGHLFNTEPND
jgi:hypothetical protein